MEALQELTGHYGDRTGWISRRRAAGGLVIGYLGADVPDELLTAADVLPVRISGDPAASLAEADRYMEPAIDQLARSQFAQLLDPDTGGRLDHVVIAHDSEGSVRIFYYLRELRRVEPRPGLPQLHFLDLLHLPTHTSTRYNVARLHELREVLRGWTGHDVPLDRVRAAIRLHNRIRALLAEVAGLRAADPPRLLGSEALAVIGAGTWMPRAAYAELLQRLLDGAGRLPERPGTRVFLTGSAHDHPGFYTFLERHGYNVVGEDHDWGNGSFEQPVEETGDPLEALAERYQHGAPTTSRYSITDRAAYTARKAAACRADLVVCHLRAGDDGPAWDYPAQSAAAAGAGIPSVALRHQPYAAEPAPEVAGILAAARPLEAHAGVDA